MGDKNVILAKQVDVSKFKYSTPRTLDNQSRSVYVNYEGGGLAIQTPLMSLPYGLGDWNDKNEESGKKDAIKKYDLNISFNGADSNPKVKELLDKMVEIEKKITDDAFENRVAWLNDDYDGIKSVVNKLFTPIVKYDKDKATKKIVGKYPPTMKLKLPYDSKNETFTFIAQDMGGDDVEFKSIMRNLKGAKARLIIQLSGIWIAGGRFGCIWKVVKARFEITKARNVDFIEDSDVEVDEEKEKDEDDELLKADALANAFAKKTTVEESDASDSEEEAEAAEEEEENDSEIEEPPPPPPVKKTSATKKPAKK
jgi:hypothetical protein